MPKGWCFQSKVWHRSRRSSRTRSQQLGEVAWFVLEWQPKLLFMTSSLVIAFTVAHRMCEKVACSVLESQISGRHLVDAEGFGFDDLSK
jgi:hypothetical protein